MISFREKFFRAWRRNADRWEAVRPGIGEETGLRVWNPGRYGLPIYERFHHAFSARGPGALLALGLNPGKYGMAQTGIPFTDVRRARALAGLGFDLPEPGIAPDDLRPHLRIPYQERSSISVYAFLSLAFGSPEEGWRRLHAMSPCTLLFLTPEGENVTPADARLARRADVRDLRRQAIGEAIEACEPRAILLLGGDVGRLARDGARAAVGADHVLEVDHPVARGPGRRGPAWWAETLTATLRARGLVPPRPEAPARGSTPPA